MSKFTSCSQLIVVDFESTCFEDEEYQRDHSEIIEIGIAVIDVSEQEVVSKESVIVKPSRSEISPFCTKLTTLTKEYVEENGISFSEACSYIRKKYNTLKYPWCSWGMYDRTMLEKQCYWDKVKYPMNRTHFNVKTLFSLKHRLPEELGMAQALQHVGLPLEGVHHRGVDDAWNIARLVLSILR